MKTVDKKLNLLFEYFDRKDIEYSYGQLQDHDANLLDEMILITNWNNRPDSMQDWVEDMDSITTGFDDEYIQCECGRFILTIPQYYGWVPNYIMGDGWVMCRECVEDDMDSLIDEYKNSTNKAIPDWSIESVKKEGFICLDDMETESCQRFQNGLYRGMNDNPVDIIKGLCEELEVKYLDEKYDYLFAITGSGQFSVDFALFLKEV